MSTPEFAAILIIEMAAVGMLSIAAVTGALRIYDWWTQR